LRKKTSNRYLHLVQGAWREPKIVPTLEKSRR
jgi:hypothetical protein